MTDPLTDRLAAALREVVADDPETPMPWSRRLLAALGPDADWLRAGFLLAELGDRLPDAGIDVGRTGAGDWQASWAGVDPTGEPIEDWADGHPTPAAALAALLAKLDGGQEP